MPRRSVLQYALLRTGSIDTLAPVLCKHFYDFNSGDSWRIYINGSRKADSTY